MHAKQEYNFKYNYTNSKSNIQISVVGVDEDKPAPIELPRHRTFPTIKLPPNANSLSPRKSLKSKAEPPSSVPLNDDQYLEQRSTSSDALRSSNSHPTLITQKHKFSFDPPPQTLNNKYLQEASSVSSEKTSPLPIKKYTIKKSFDSSEQSNFMENQHSPEKPSPPPLLSPSPSPSPAPLPSTLTDNGIPTSMPKFSNQEEVDSDSPFHPTPPSNNKNRYKLLNSSDSTTFSEVPIPLPNLHIKAPKSADSSTSSIDSESENNPIWLSSSSPPPNPTH